ncbi:tetratricopeptide repeat protein [Saccharothrix sp. BKS2]
MEGVHGPDSPEAIAGLHGVAVTLHLQEDYEGARRVVERALAISEERLGPDHPATVTALGGLAHVLHHRGRTAEAVEPAERVVGIVERYFEPDHPRLVWYREALARMRA